MAPREVVVALGQEAVGVVSGPEVVVGTMVVV